MKRYLYWTWATLAVGAAACGGGTGPDDRPTPPAVAVSNVLAGPSDTGTVWVSLTPGTMPDGTDATVTTTLAEGVVDMAMVNGGFDPVPLPALDGDTVTVVVHGAAGDLVTYIVPVPVRVP